MSSYRSNSTSQGQALTGLPAVEGVRVMGQQCQQLCVGVVKVQHYGRGKAAQDGRHRLFSDAGEGDAGGLTGHHKQVVRSGRVGVALHTE